MNIAEVSKKFGLTADTLRYYERIGLLQKRETKAATAITAALTASA